MHALQGAEAVGLEPLQQTPSTAYATTAGETSRSEGDRDPEEGVAGRYHIKERLAVTEPQDETGRRRKER